MSELTMIATEGAAPRRTAHPRFVWPETPQAPTVRAARNSALRKSKTADIWLSGLLTLAVIAALFVWARTIVEMISEVVGLMPLR